MFSEILIFGELFSGVVVIDNQPEVIIDAPAYLFESNEGFQEVTSKKPQKLKQKAAQKEVMMMKKPSAELLQQAQAVLKKREDSKKDKVTFFVDIVCRKCICHEICITQFFFM
jgi:predicted nucleic acid-binding protein